MSRAVDARLIVSVLYEREVSTCVQGERAVPREPIARGSLVIAHSGDESHVGSQEIRDPWVSRGLSVVIEETPTAAWCGRLVQRSRFSDVVMLKVSMDDQMEVASGRERRPCELEDSSGQEKLTLFLQPAHEVSF